MAAHDIDDSHSENTDQCNENDTRNHAGHNDWEPYRSRLERVPPCLVAFKLGIDRLQADLHRVEHDRADCKDGEQRRQAVRQERSPLRVNVEEGELALEEHGCQVETAEAQLAVLVAFGDLAVANHAEGPDEPAPLFVGRVFAVRLLGNQPLLAGHLKVNFILDEIEVAPHEAQAGFVKVLVCLLNVLPKGLAVKVGGYGLDEDSLIVPDKVQAGVLVDLDVSVV